VGRPILLVALVLAASIPVALLATILAMPLWRAVESQFGIESVGHSGPASWCFLSVYALFAAGGILLVRKRLGA